MKSKLGKIILFLVLCMFATGVALAEDVVYVVNSYVHPPKPGWSTVSMIRNSTFAILKTLTLWGADAHTVAVTPDKTRLWVTSPPDNVIFIIDAETFEISSTKYLGDVIIYRPMGVAFTPDGNYAYVTLEETGEINVYNASTAAYVTTISVGGMPNYIVFTPSGDKAYVVDYQNTQIVVIRTSDNSVLTTIPFSGHTIQDAVVSPDGSKVYVSNMDQNQIEIIRTSDDTVLSPIPTTEIKPRGIGISPDGNYLFIGHYMAVDAVVNMMRLSDNTIVSSASIPSNPRCIAVKDNGRRIVVTEHNEDECYAYSVNGESLVFTAVTDLNTVAGYNASPVGVAFGEYPNPIPDIKINGLDGPITLTNSDSVRLTLHLDNNTRIENADWYLAGDSPFGLVFWTPSTNWTTSWLPMYQGPLAYLDEFASATIPLTGFPIGTYTFIFAVDVMMDGVVSLPYAYWDAVILNISE